MNCNVHIYRRWIAVRLDWEESSASGYKNEFKNKPNSQHKSQHPAQMRLCNRVMFYDGKSLRDIQCWWLLRWSMLNKTQPLFSHRMPWRLSHQTPGTTWWADPDSKTSLAWCTTAVLRSISGDSIASGQPRQIAIYTW